jgi:hypothetical protein
LLGRLDEYTGYLRTLAGKLAHEIRTPAHHHPFLAREPGIGSNSSNGMASTGMGENAKVYIAARP